MRIRPYRKSDAKAFTDLVKGLAKYEKLKPPSPAACRRIVADIGPRIRVLLCESEGKSVGYAIYFFTYSSFLARPTLYLEDLFILPEHRRGGAGAKFFAALLREARRAHCGRMEWMVLDWNAPAHRFYEKLGARRLREWVPYRMSL